MDEAARTEPRAGAGGAPFTPAAFDNLRLVYLPGYRNPLDELARREAQILVELLRAGQQRLHGHQNLVDIRNQAAQSSISSFTPT